MPVPTGQPFRRRGAQRLLGEPLGLGRRVGVEAGFGDVVVTEPEAEAHHLARVGLAHHRVDRGPLFHVPVGEPGHGDVEGVPEVVHGAGLAGETGCELLQDQIDLAQDPPVPRGVFGHVDGVLVVLDEGAVGVGQVERERDRDPAVHPQRVQRRLQTQVERGDAVPLEGEGGGVALQVARDQQVADEVEVDGEDRVAVHQPHRSGGDPASGQVEGHVPPVVASRAVL